MRVAPAIFKFFTRAPSRPRAAASASRRRERRRGLLARTGAGNVYPLATAHQPGALAAPWRRAPAAFLLYRDDKPEDSAGSRLAMATPRRTNIKTVAHYRKITDGGRWHLRRVT